MSRNPAITARPDFDCVAHTKLAAKVHVAGSCHENRAQRSGDSGTLAPLLQCELSRRHASVVDISIQFEERDND